jgi:hypothetical protein
VSAASAGSTGSSRRLALVDTDAVCCCGR